MARIKVKLYYVICFCTDKEIYLRYCPRQAHALARDKAKETGRDYTVVKPVASYSRSTSKKTYNQ